MSHVSDGRAAEAVVAEYLRKKGFEIISQNWRTRSCEIDVIASKDGDVYFVEVKYRRSNLQGTGLDYITDRKLAQMRYAASMWLQENNWNGDMFLCAAEVSGSDFVVSCFIDTIFV